MSNRCPTRSVQGKTPQQAWSRKKPTVFHLHVLGSIAYAHVPDQKRSKLDDKGKKYVFIGYGQSINSYKLYNTSIGKAIVSRGVEFDKEGTWIEAPKKKRSMIFFPLSKEEEQRNEVQKEHVTPPPSPVASSPIHESPSSSSLQEGSSHERPRKMRSL